MKNIIIIFLLITAAFALIKCSDKDFDLTDPNVISATQFYKTPDDAEAAVVAVYDAWKQTNDDQNGNGLDMLSEDVNGTAPPAFNDFSITRQNGWVSLMWTDSYVSIYRANLALSKIPGITFTDPAQQTRLLGEAYFLRAYNYMYLLLYYGGVPIITEAVDITNTAALNPPRATVDAVYAQIESDLTTAIADLPSYYDAANVGRATKGAAMGYLGWIYMLEKKYAQAKTQFEQLMALSPVNTAGLANYGLLPKFSDNFQGVANNKWSQEAIWQLNYSNQFAVANMWGGGVNQYRAKMAAWGACGYPNAYAVRVFELTDTVRLFASVLNCYKVRAPGDTIGNRRPNPSKKWASLKESDLYQGKYINQYKPQNNIYGTWNGTGPTEGWNINLMRYSNVLLLYAEAVNELNNQATAITYLNMVRSRAKVPLYPTYTYSSGYPNQTVTGDGTQGDVRNAIKHERQVEFYDEQWHWFDNVRYGDCVSAYKTANDFEASIGSTTPKQNFIANKNELLPIPDAEMNLNSAMKGNQNPGY